MAATAPPASGAATAREDPYRSYNIKVLLGDVEGAHFTECSGLGVRVEAIPYREAGTPQTVLQLPGRVEYSEVTLRYGLTSRREVFEWMMATSRGEIERRNVSICIRDTTGASEVVRWNLMSCWPKEWRGAPLDVMSNQVAIATLVLCHEGLECEQPS